MKTFAKLSRNILIGISVAPLFLPAACGNPVTATPTPSHTGTVIIMETPRSTPAQSNIVAIGDSVTRGGTRWTLLGHENTIAGGWVARLQIRLNEDFPGEYRVINQGSDGDTARGVHSRLSSVNQYQPTIILLGIGSNDVVGITTVEQYQAEMEGIIEELQQELPEANIFLVGFTAYVKKYAEMAYSFINYDSQDLLDSKANDFNEVLKKLAENSGVFYVDVPAQWPVDVEERWDLLADGLHPNDAGHDQMMEIIYSSLISSLSEASNQ